MKTNTIILIIVTLVIAAGAYWYFFVGSGNQSPIAATSPSGNAQEAQFNALVSQLGLIKFNTQIFSDPRFSSLVDISTVVTSEPIGRADPFAAIPGVTGK